MGVAYINIIIPISLGNVVNIISTGEGHDYIPLRCLKLVGLYLAQVSFEFFLVFIVYIYLYF